MMLLISYESYESYEPLKYLASKWVWSISDGNFHLYLGFNLWRKKNWSWVEIFRSQEDNVLLRGENFIKKLTIGNSLYRKGKVGKIIERKCLTAKISVNRVKVSWRRLDTRSLIYSTKFYLKKLTCGSLFAKMESVLGKDQSFEFLLFFARLLSTNFLSNSQVICQKNFLVWLSSHTWSLSDSLIWMFFNPLASR